MNNITAKLLSGRLWLTIIAGLVFAYATYSKILNSEAVAAIVTLVFMAYFQRPDRPEVDSQPKQTRPPIEM
jgi:hypothetical protein